MNERDPLLGEPIPSSRHLEELGALLASHLLGETAALLSELPILRSRSHAILAVASHKKGPADDPHGPEVDNREQIRRSPTGPQPGDCADMVNDW